MRCSASPHRGTSDCSKFYNLWKIVGLLHTADTISTADEEAPAGNSRSDPQLCAGDGGRDRRNQLTSISTTSIHSSARAHLSRLPWRDASPLRAFPARHGTGGKGLFPPPPRGRALYECA